MAESGWPGLCAGQLVDGGEKEHEIDGEAFVIVT